MKLQTCLILFLFSICSLGMLHAAESWHIILGEEHVADEAIRLAVSDLQEIGDALGVIFKVDDDSAATAEFPCLIVGDALRNRVTAAWTKAGKIAPAHLGKSEGYAISTVYEQEGRAIVVAGASILGDVYGLYWIWDRMRVHRGLPDINVVREPALDIRLGAAWGRQAYGGSTREQMHGALRYSFNWVSGPTILDLVPWAVEPESSKNAAHREKARELIAYAHELHMKYYAFANAFTYHPSLLEEFGASLSPCDPLFWDAVQEEYRRLFQALPELDGISLCNDDISGFWERYLPFDITREAPECDWSYVKRFHTFVSKVHDVAVGEFDKIYFHFTWGLREHEVHCQPEVFRAVFNDIPTHNIYLMPKITRGDRWWHQPYNATFNQTPHPTVVLFECMNYYESGTSNLFPTFSGRYFQRGLQTFLEPETSNVRGAAALAGAARDGWGTTGAYAYVLYRLMWSPNDSIEQIARDFCAIHFGVAAAESMARIYLLSPNAYQYGLHIEPISYGQFNSFLHMRVGVFPAEGYTAIDNGKEHLTFLKRVYLRCEPWREETLRALEQGRQTAEQMMELFQTAKLNINDPALVEHLEDRLTMTHNLIRTNIGYVNTMFAYFDYMDSESGEHLEALKQVYKALAEARADFMNTPGFDYKLFGVDVLMQNAVAAIENVTAAREQIRQTPNRQALETIIAEQQQKYREVLANYKDRAAQLARFEILVDGQDMLILSGDAFHVENIRWDGAHVEVGELLTALPRQNGTVIPLDIESRPMHPFVLEQPSQENDYAVRIYLDDAPGGNGWMKFDLYYLPLPPEQLGLAVPWSTSKISPPVF